MKCRDFKSGELAELLMLEAFFAERPYIDEETILLYEATGASKEEIDELLRAPPIHTGIRVVEGLCHIDSCGRDDRIFQIHLAYSPVEDAFYVQEGIELIERELHLRVGEA